MFSKSLISFCFLLALTSSVNAQSIISPPVGVPGKPVESDAQRPSDHNPRGNVNIAQNLDTSPAVPVDADGALLRSIANFDPRTDGSRSIKRVQVDATGTGKNVVAAQMLVNGDMNPTNIAFQNQDKRQHQHHVKPEVDSKKVKHTHHASASSKGNKRDPSKGGEGKGKDSEKEKKESPKEQGDKKKHHKRSWSSRP